MAKTEKGKAADEVKEPLEEKAEDETETVDEEVKNESVRKPEDLVEIRIPRSDDPSKNDDVFCSFNFKNYLIKRGVTVKVPRALAEILENSEKAKDAAIEYAQEKRLKQP